MIEGWKKKNFKGLEQQINYDHLVDMYSSKRSRSYKERKAVAGLRIRRIILIIFLFIFYQFFTIYVSTPLKVHSRSMEPALEPSDRILFSRASLKAQTMFNYFSFWGIERGDLVVIRPPYYRENQQFIDIINPAIRFFTFQKIQFSTYKRPEWEIPFIIKRIVGLPGDRVRIIDFMAYIRTPGEDTVESEYDLSRGNYSINEADLPEGWVSGLPLDGYMDEITLGEDEFFVLSDSRGRGNDSMVWGPLKEEFILGKVLFRYYPFSRLSPL